MPLNIKTTRAWAEIDLSAIRQNYTAAVAHCRPYGAKVAAVVKADGYGHGAVTIANELEKYCSAEYFAVATFTEALELSEAVKSPIIILSEIHRSLYSELVSHKTITPSIFHIESAKALSEVAIKANTSVNCFISLDTGMSRIGIDCTSPEKIAEAVDTVKTISSLDGISVAGIFSHYACADSADKTSASRQSEMFELLLSKLKKEGVKPEICSICNSAAIVDSEIPNKHDLVRLGISLYGFGASEHTANVLPLKPAMALRARITEVKTLGAGVGVGYGHTFVTTKPTRVATIPVGYADGYPRLLSNKASVIIDEKEAPIIGRICMDQMMVDVTDIPSAQIDSVATLIGADKRIRADVLGDMIGTIPYEIVCSIAPRVPRIYTNGFASINNG